MSILYLLIFVLLTSTAHAEEPDLIVVTATRTESNASTIASDISVMSGDDVRDKGGTDLTNALNSLPGLHVISNGGPGQPKNLSIRGAKSEGTLVLVDGVVVNDPLSPSRGFDFANLPLDSIERVEVIRGPESVLYGSDALGGVVNIITKTKLEKPNLSAEAGAYGTYQAALNASGFSSSFVSSRGFSAADTRLGNNEADGYRRYSFAGKRAYGLGENTVAKVQAQYIDSRVDTDTNGGIGGDSFNTQAEDSQLISRGEITNFSHDDKLKTTAGVSFSNHNRIDNTSGPAHFDGSILKGDLQEDYTALPNQVVTLGFEAQSERGRSTDFNGTKYAKTISAFLQDQWTPGRFFATLGARADKHSLYGFAETMRSAAGFWIVPSKTKIKSSYGTAFKAPSLYQNFSSFGSQALKPSRGKAWDAGIEQYFHDVNFELNFFENRYSDLIDFNSATSKYANISATESYGIEFITEINPAGRFKLENSVTGLKAYDRNTGLLLVREPQWSDSLSLHYKFSDKTKISTTWQYTGQREDIDPVSSARVNMPAYLLVGLSGEHALNEKLSITARLDNLLDRTYEDVRGYGTERISAYFGIKTEL